MIRTIYSTLIFALTLSLAACGEKPRQTESQIEETNNEKFMPQPAKKKDGPKTVVILSSSPRRGGNSKTLCLQFKKGAEEAGHKVEMININDYDIRYFDQQEYDRAASAAETDDAAAIIAKMKEADVIVLSSPVYFYNMTAQLKALIDRTYGHEKDLNDKEFFYISTSTDRDDESTDGVFEAFHGFARCLYGSVERGIIRGNGARNRGDIDSHPAMEQAYEMGKGV